jgi:hypothetical protein
MKLATDEPEKIIKLLEGIAGQWFSPGTLVSSTNKTDCHDITEILLKMLKLI